MCVNRAGTLVQGVSVSREGVLVPGGSVSRVQVLTQGVSIHALQVCMGREYTCRDSAHASKGEEATVCYTKLPSALPQDPRGPRGRTPTLRHPQCLLCPWKQPFPGSPRGCRGSTPPQLPEAALSSTRTCDWWPFPPRAQQQGPAPREHPPPILPELPRHLKSPSEIRQEVAAAERDLPQNYHIFHAIYSGAFIYIYIHIYIYAASRRLPGRRGTHR